MSGGLKLTRRKCILVILGNEWNEMVQFIIWTCVLVIALSLLYILTSVYLFRSRWEHTHLQSDPEEKAFLTTSWSLSEGFEEHGLTVLLL